jgi:hypothetical protein
MREAGAVAAKQHLRCRSRLSCPATEPGRHTHEQGKWRQVRDQGRRCPWILPSEVRSPVT